MNTIMASFNRTVRKMTEMCQQNMTEMSSKKWPKYLSKEKLDTILMW